MQVDRDGDVLIPQGCDATEFQKSPTVFFNHDYTLPIGKCVGILRDASHLEAKTIFAKRPDNHIGTWFSDTLLSLFQQGVINGFSVGFHPIESRHPSKKDRALFGPTVKRVFSKWKLLEYSIAPLPANQEALALAVSKGLVACDAAKKIFPAADFSMKPKRRTIVLIHRSSSNTIAKPSVIASCPSTIARQLVLKKMGQLYDTNPRATLHENK